MTDKGNQNATKTGAEAGIKRLADGKPFTSGLAIDAQRNVEARLEVEGLEAIVNQNAIRAQTVLELYWTAIQAAADAGDLAKLDAYTARWGWLCGVTLRAWAQVKADRKGKGGRLDEVLEAYSKDRAQERTETAERGATNEAGAKHGEIPTQDTPQEREVPPRDFDTYNSPPQEVQE